MRVGDFFRCVKSFADWIRDPELTALYEGSQESAPVNVKCKTL